MGRAKRDAPSPVAQPDEDLEDDVPSAVEEEAPPPPKRAREDNDHRQYKRGAIKKVVVENFMTYHNRVKITPGPRLNLVIGPNGSGKSAIVCAIGMGLGGSIKLMGRAQDLSEFLHHGCTRAMIEITLSQGRRKSDLVVRRVITKDTIMEDGQQKYKFNNKYTTNGNAATLQAVREKMEELNIQFENLCQFVPQERVKEFASMGSKELLIATEQALGDARLYTLHMELIEDRKKVKAQQGDLGRSTGRLQGLHQEHERQKRDYERVARREELREEIQLIRDKLTWMRVIDLKVETKEAERLLKAAAQEERALSSKSAGDDAPVQAATAAVKAAAGARDKAKKAVQKADAELRAARAEVDSVKEELEAILQQQESLQGKSAERGGRIGTLQQEIADLEAQHARLPEDLPPEELQRLREVTAQHNEQFNQARAAEERQSEAQREQQAANTKLMSKQAAQSSMGNVRDRRLAALMQGEAGHRFRRLPELVAWVRDNRAHFRGDVYGPVAVEIDVRGPPVAGAGPAAPAAGPRPARDAQEAGVWAAILEKQCGPTLFNFVVCEREDERALCAKITQLGMNITVNVVTTPNARVTPVPHDKGEPAQYAGYGVTHTLDQLFDAPHLVKHMLSDTRSINRAYVCQDRDTAHELMSKTPISDLYCGLERMSYSRSKYNREAETTQNEFAAPARTLGGESLAHAEAQRVRVQAEVDAAQQDFTAKTAALEALRGELHTITASLLQCEAEVQAIRDRRAAMARTRAKVQSDLGMRRRLLQQKQAEPDPLDQAPALQAQQAGLLRALTDKAAVLPDKAMAQWTALQAYMIAELAVKEREAQVEAAKTRMLQARTQLNAARRHLDMAKRVCDEAKAAFREAKAAAEQDAPRDEARLAQMQELPNDVPELRQLMADKQAERDSIAVVDAGIIQQYQQRQLLISELQADVDLGRAQVEEAQAALDAKREAWLPELQRLVTSINDKFSENFADMGCAGEVKLREHEDYDEWALEIWVSFRPTEGLHLLTASRQSGGERSVSTMLYLLSLQGVTETPFRVVDEINQGMDDFNERRVYTQLVEASLKPDTPQCFIITPKLLPGLSYEPQITVLNIMNGVGVPEDVVKSYDDSVKSHGTGVLALLGKRAAPFLTNPQAAAA